MKQISVLSAKNIADLKMDLIQQGQEVLFVWSGQNVVEIEKQVTELKELANVRLESSDRLEKGINKI